MITMSVDDGCASDVRVAELAKKYGIETTFYWPVEWHSLANSKGYRPLDYLSAVAIAMQHEIGSHTITHRHLTDLPFSEAMEEIDSSRIMIQDLFHVNVRKFCPPRGYTNERLTECTLKNYDSQRLTRGEGLVHVHPNSGANNNMHWLEYTKTIEVKELWMHSYELDRYPEEWENLENFMKAVQ